MPFQRLVYHGFPNVKHHTFYGRIQATRAVHVIIFRTMITATQVGITFWNILMRKDPITRYFYRNHRRVFLNKVYFMTSFT